MTKQDFIIQYVLQNKEMPNEKLLEDMEKAEVFSNKESILTEMKKSIDSTELKIYEDCTVVCKRPIQFGNNILLPKGFVCRIDTIRRATRDGYLKIFIKIMSNPEGKGKLHTKRSHGIVMFEESLTAQFKVIDVNNMLSSIFDYPYAHSERKDGVVQYSHRYEIDESTLHLELL